MAGKVSPSDLKAERSVGKGREKTKVIGLRGAIRDKISNTSR